MKIQIGKEYIGKSFGNHIVKVVKKGKFGVLYKDGNNYQLASKTNFLDWYTDDIKAIQLKKTMFMVTYFENEIKNKLESIDFYKKELEKQKKKLKDLQE